MGVWEAMLKQQRENLATGDMRAFRYTLLMKDFWTEEYMQSGVYKRSCSPH